MRVCWKSLSASFAAGGSTRAIKSAIATVLACAGSEPLGKLVFTDHRSTPFTIGLLLGMHCPQLSLPAGVEAGCASGVLGDVAGAFVCFFGAGRDFFGSWVGSQPVSSRICTAARNGLIGPPTFNVCVKALIVTLS